MSDDLDELKNKLEFVDIKVTVFKECNSKTGKPIFEETTVKTIKGLQVQEQLKFAIIAKLEALQCENNCTATVPEWWQLRPEAHRPQLICVFVELKEDGTLGRNQYSLTLPHPKSNKPPETAPLPNYKKDNIEAILTLKDNSKVIINAETKEECSKMIDAIKAKINDDYLKDSYIKIGERKGQKFAEIMVKLIRVDYYPKGSAEMRPEWVKYFRGKQ